MKLIFALGNPEPRYDDTRHNVGFWVADNWVKNQASQFSLKPKLKAQIAEVRVGEEKIIVAKPTTYYNLVGESYRAIVDFYKLAPQDVLVIADDLALPIGTLRTRQGGSGAGSNGIKSLNAHGGQETMRLRIGTANSLVDKMPAADFVLSRFSADEKTSLQAMNELVEEIIKKFINDSLEATTHRYSLS